MDLWNLDPSNGFFNGIIMVCKYFEPSVMCVEITAKQYARKQVLLPRIPLLSAKNEGYPFYFKHAQLLIQLNFAMTITKTQGKCIYLDMPSHMVNYMLHYHEKLQYQKQKFSSKMLLLYVLL